MKLQQLVLFYRSVSLKSCCARRLFRFVSGAMCVWLFAVVALELKYRAPNAHTMLEVVEVRWGKVAHVVSFFELFNSARASQCQHCHSSRRLPPSPLVYTYVGAHQCNSNCRLARGFQPYLTFSAGTTTCKFLSFQCVVSTAPACEVCTALDRFSSSLRSSRTCSCQPQCFKAAWLSLMP